ncbi:unnamed protein product, partial [Mesorhabditis spiculigera]
MRAVNGVFTVSIKYESFLEKELLLDHLWSSWVLSRSEPRITSFPEAVAAGPDQEREKGISSRNESVVPEATKEQQKKRSKLAALQHLLSQPRINQLRCMDPKIALLVFYLIFLLPIYGDLRKKLKGFEIINTARKRINKRDLLENGRSVVEIELSEKTYKLHLEPAKGLIDSKFRAILRHPDGGVEIENIGVDELFHGRVEGCLRSWVRLVHSPGNGLFGAFSCDIEQIYLEPHFLHNATAPDDEMIVYRQA